MIRSFLFLQGVASPFFSELGRQLRRSGHRSHRINFCGGDLLFALGEAHTNYRGTLADLPIWLIEAFRRHQVTDMVLFGDCRPMHQAAMAVARQHAVRIHVFEEGYLRPNWITLERNGVNGFSALSSSPDVIRRWAQARNFGEDIQESQPAASNLMIRAVYDIVYRMASTVLVWFFPHIHTHRPYNGLLEYAGLARRFGLARWFDKEARQVTAALVAAKTPFFLFPLQLNADFQIKCHSPFADCLAAIDHVLTSFAASITSPQHANVQLVIKNHPLDTGLSRYRSYAEQRGRDLGISGHIRFIEAGDLTVLLHHARGVVLVNSTVGMTAVALHRPVLALGKAIYNLPGLTHQKGLTSFWRHPEPPDPEFVKVFMHYVKELSQVRGDFYSNDGIRRSAQACVQRMQKDES